MTRRLPSIEELRRNAPDLGGPSSAPTDSGTAGFEPPTFEPPEFGEPHTEVPRMPALAPAVLALTVDEAIVAEGDDIVLRWEVVDADELTIDGIGDVPAIGSARILAEATGAFVLRAANRVGETVRRSPDVRILLMPEVARVVLPELEVLRRGVPPRRPIDSLQWMAPGRLEGMPGAAEPVATSGPSWAEMRQRPV